MSAVLYLVRISYIYKVRFGNENKNQSNEDKALLYQHIITDIAFSLVSILCSY